MIEKETINVNHIDGNLLNLRKIFQNTNLQWIEEINIDGDNFNYDSQDIYRQALNEILIKSEIIEKINPQTEKEERQILVEDLLKAVNENLKLFKNHRDLFSDLPRKKIIIKEYKQREFPESTKSDIEIYDNFIMFKELTLRPIYFKSELYNTVGFLEVNYHEKIYYYSLSIKKQLETKFKSSDSYDSNYLNVYNTIFLNMGVVHQIHYKFNGIAFEEISESQLYKALNLQNTVTYLKKKDSRKLFYIVHHLGELLNDQLKEIWLKAILEEMQVTKKYYSSQYKFFDWTDANEKQKGFAKEFNTFMTDKIKPLLH
ncbi:hypothetical protein ACFQ3R_05060 [Mesonia ostreae]|uniref:Uncharacterized protein n=1 Tax=Mesonia ostreae TaxID=861110 RepID=A0ABU2KKE7_9FLAO|nr:hypothetical protein [Mesonia ostreae]MDT0295183.1 hypothetical protein [Mesonia ostreae]